MHVAKFKCIIQGFVRTCENIVIEYQKKLTIIWEIYISETWRRSWQSHIHVLCSMLMWPETIQMINTRLAWNLIDCLIPDVFCIILVMLSVLQHDSGCLCNCSISSSSNYYVLQTLTDPINKRYTTHSECSIEFEVDGPYKVMLNSYQLI